jgi:hypothetical protein
MKPMKRMLIGVAVILCMVTGNLYSQVGISNSGSVPDNSSMLDIKSSSKGLLIPRMTQAERLAISSPATGLLVFQTIVGQGFYYYDGNVWTALGGGGGGGGVHYPGELYGGGVVFYVDNSGMHGLICSMVDLSTAQPWSDVTNVLIGPGAESDWNGPANTASIISQPDHTASAAKVCDDYTNADYGTGIYSDWYLPALDQLIQIFLARYEVTLTLDTDGNSTTTPLTKTTYWSSTEFSDVDAFVYDFYWTYPYAASKTSPISVRAIRSF